jgi:uncharacterized membrane protein (DUF373 family)
LKFSASHANIICAPGLALIGLNRHGKPFDQNSKAYCSRVGGFADRRCSSGHRRSRFIAQDIWKPPRFLIPVQGLLEIFSFFLVILIGVELLETLKAYVKKDVIHVRLVLEVALIAMARKVIILEPNSVTALTLFGMAALISALGAAFYFERKAHREQLDP